jgi:hypothetical protein
MHSRLESLPGSPVNCFFSVRHSLTYLLCAFGCIALIASAGCGQLKSYTATEQILLSNAVDEAVQKLDFTPLAGKKVFVDTSFIRDGKTYGCVHDGYLISSVRQQMMSDGCLLFDKREEADVIVEARVGTLGADAHEITYGLPASNALSSAATVMGAGAPIPAIPEISLAKKTQNDGAAKVALFAFDAKTREPLWQSGVSLAKTTSANTWFLGAGPWPKRKKWKLFGGSDETEKIVSDDDEEFSPRGKVAFDHSHVFPALRRLHEGKPPELIAKTEPAKVSTRVADESPQPPAENNAVKAVSHQAAGEPEKKPEPPKQALASSAAVGQ